MKVVSKIIGPHTTYLPKPVRDPIDKASPALSVSTFIDTPGPRPNLSLPHAPSDACKHTLPFKYGISLRVQDRTMHALCTRIVASGFVSEDSNVITATYTRFRHQRLILRRAPATWSQALYNLSCFSQVTTSLCDMIKSTKEPLR